MKNILKKRIGIIGGGQLGKMMILEAKRLGLYVITLDPDANCAAGSISDELIVADVYDENAIIELAGKADVITYEWEKINAEALIRLEKDGHVIYPSASSLLIIQDKYLQKSKLRENNIKVPDFEAVADLDFLKEYAGRNGYPIMLKARKNGYDGKGNFVIRSQSELEAGFNAMKQVSEDIMVEEFTDFAFEVSVVATRGINGKKAVYPIPYNVHKDSILDMMTIPADLSDDLHKNICAAAEKVMDVFDGVGTFCVEMFVGRDGQIYINEVAPRPHNSGHYTIEGCRTNQFENHIRAILGLPLGSAELLHGGVIMRNLLGHSNGIAKVEGIEEAYAISDRVNIHIYGKNECKTARKMGHYTITAETVEKAKETDDKIKNLVKITGE
jgi:5-(carboxyamino)imidazole ribonucleotide synthase